MLRRFMNNCEIYFYVILFNNEKILINNQINEIINEFKLMWCQVETSIYGLKINKNINYDVYVSNMINIVINKLDKEKLNDLKNKYNLDYYLVIKPEIYINDIKQCLSLDDNIIEFLYLTKTHLDLDYYLYE